MNLRDWLGLGPLLLVFLTSTALADALPRYAGVGTHFHHCSGNVRKALDVIKAAGMNSFRDGPSRLAQCNKMVNQAIDLATSPTAGYNLDPLVLLSFELTQHPYNLSSAAAAVVQEYGTRVRLYEIWNEWGNFGYGAWTQDSYRDYTKKVLCPTYQAIKQINPNAVVIGGGGIWLTFWPGVYGMFNNGGADCMDGLSIHPYWGHYKGRSRGSPTNVMAELTKLHDWIKTHTGKDMPLYITEEGWSTADCGRQCADENTVAQYIRDYFTAAKSVPFVKGIWWYMLRDSEGPAGLQYSFGIVRPDYNPKPAYNEMKAVAPSFR